MTHEISVSTHEEFNLTSTAHGNIRLSIDLTTYLLTPEDAIILGNRLTSLAIRTRWDKYNQGETTNDLIS